MKIVAVGEGEQFAVFSRGREWLAKKKSCENTRNSRGAIIGGNQV
jgi:hypothetical protein